MVEKTVPVATAAWYNRLLGCRDRREEMSRMMKTGRGSGDETQLCLLMMVLELVLASPPEGLKNLVFELDFHPLHDSSRAGVTDRTSLITTIQDVPAALHSSAPPQQREGGGQATAGLQPPQPMDTTWNLLSESLCATLESDTTSGLSAGHGSHGSRSLEATAPRWREVVVVQVHVGQKMPQGVPALRRGKANQRGVTPLGKHRPRRRFAGVRCEEHSRSLVLPDGSRCCSERSRLQVAARSGFGQDLAVGRRRILHQDCLLVTGRLPECI